MHQEVTTLDQCTDVSIINKQLTFTLSKVPRLKLALDIMMLTASGSIFPNVSQEHFLSFTPIFCKFDRNTTSDWINHYGLANEVMLLSKASKYRKKSGE